MASLSSRLRRRAIDGLTTLLVLALLLAIAEGLFRVFAQNTPLPERPSSMAASLDRELPQLHLGRDFTQPGVHGLTAGAEFKANRDGFRGPERSRNKPQGMTRIAILGDSTAMGWGVEEASTYAAQLEDRFDAEKRSGPVEVLNFAVAGLNSTGVLQRFEDLALDFQPDIVIYGYSINDIEGPAYRHSLDRKYAASLFEHDSPSHLWRWLRPQWLALRELAFTPRGTFAFELDENYFRNPEAWNTVRDNFKDLAQLGRKHGFCGVLLVHTQMQALNALHPYKRHYAAIVRAAREADLVAVESLDLFLEEEASSLWVNPNDRHANDRGHSIFAKLLAQSLDTLPSKCWATPLEHGAPPITIPDSGAGNEQTARDRSTARGRHRHPWVTRDLTVSALSP